MAFKFSGFKSNRSKMKSARSPRAKPKKAGIFSKLSSKFKHGGKGGKHKKLRQFDRKSAVDTKMIIQPEDHRIQEEIVKGLDAVKTGRVCPAEQDHTTADRC